MATRSGAGSGAGPRLGTAPPRSQLGWPQGRNLVDVCADSEVLGVDSSALPSCIADDVPFDVAERLCYAAGARLCELEEMAAGETAGTGCGHDYAFV